MRRWRWIGIVGAIAVVASWVVGCRERKAAEYWLSLARLAPRRYDYHGVQTTRFNIAGRTVTATVRVVHEAPDRTRWDYSGDAVEGFYVIRNGDSVWRCDPRHDVTVRTPTAPIEVPVATAGYRVSERYGGSVAGRRTQVVTLRGRCSRRQLWIDFETGLILRAWTRQNSGQETITEFHEFALGRAAEPASFDPPPETEALAEDLSLAHLSQILGFPVREPVWLPSGYRFAGSKLYDCPCGCGMKAAQLVYTDGISWLSVFEQDRRYLDCVVSEACCNLGSERRRCVASSDADLPVVARVHKQPIVVAVGDLDDRQLARVAESVPGESLSGR